MSEQSVIVGQRRLSAFGIVGVLCIAVCLAVVTFSQHWDIPVSWSFLLSESFRWFSFPMLAVLGLGRFSWAETFVFALITLASVSILASFLDHVWEVELFIFLGCVYLAGRTLGPLLGVHVASKRNMDRGLKQPTFQGRLAVLSLVALGLALGSGFLPQLGNTLSPLSVISMGFATGSGLIGAIAVCTSKLPVWIRIPFAIILMYGSHIAAELVFSFSTTGNWLYDWIHDTFAFTRRSWPYLFWDLGMQVVVGYVILAVATTCQYHVWTSTRSSASSGGRSGIVTWLLATLLVASLVSLREKQEPLNIQISLGSFVGMVTVDGEAFEISLSANGVAKCTPPQSVVLQERDFADFFAWLPLEDAVTSDQLNLGKMKGRIINELRRAYPDFEWTTVNIVRYNVSKVPFANPPQE